MTPAPTAEQRIQHILTRSDYLGSDRHGLVRNVDFLAFIEARKQVTLPKEREQ